MKQALRCLTIAACCRGVLLVLRPARRGCTGSRKPASRHAYELFDHIWLFPALADCQDGAWIVRRRTHGGQGSDHDPDHRPTRDLARLPASAVVAGARRAGGPGSRPGPRRPRQLLVDSPTSSAAPDTALALDGMRGLPRVPRLCPSLVAGQRRSSSRLRALRVDQFLGDGGQRGRRRARPHPRAR